MMEFLSEYGLFLVKTMTLVLAILFTVGGVIMIGTKHKRAHEKELKITHLNKEYENMEKSLKSALMTDHGLKMILKAEKKAEKEKNKAAKKKKKIEGDAEDVKKHIYVLDFDGDIKASAVDQLRNEVTAILTTATQHDEVVLRLESGGGVVHGYGLAASQLVRIREKEIPLTICVDKVAASGGYMMACVGNKILSAPFAIVGSIGVLAQLPNVHKLLKKNDIDFEQLSAGEYKRTLTVFGENTDKAREKMQQDLEETHGLFKDFIHANRPDLELDKVATGEYWLGTRAHQLGLVDELKTSDDYLMAASKEAEIIHLQMSKKPSLMEKIGGVVSMGALRQEKHLRELQKPMAIDY